MGGRQAGHRRGGGQHHRRPAGGHPPGGPDEQGRQARAGPGRRAGGAHGGAAGRADVCAGPGAGPSHGDVRGAGAGGGAAVHGGAGYGGALGGGAGRATGGANSDARLPQDPGTPRTGDLRGRYLPRPRVRVSQRPQPACTAEPPRRRAGQGRPGARMGVGEHYLGRARVGGGGILWLQARRSRRLQAGLPTAAKNYQGTVARLLRVEKGWGGGNIRRLRRVQS
mmetsp:Transcript_18585/g.47632  ORF Transcript_18585/g.47632 Transcript_18585/m.47632 type:complete len:224 (-) Transcript_18585:39-710(-)